MDKQKADIIIAKYLQKLYGFAVKKSFSYTEAEELCADIVHEVYLSLLKAEAVGNVDGYIWRISEHAYVKYVSLKKRHDGLPLEGIIDTYTDNTLTDEAEEEENKLCREIAFLTQKRREIVYLFYFKNTPISSISQNMGIPEGTVKWHLNQARNELKEGFLMERKIGKLGLSPISATGFGHGGNPGNTGGPEYYLGDKLNLNIVYSVYHSPKTREEIAEELGITPVFIEDKIGFLEENGYLVKKAGNRLTTYVKFSPETYSLQLQETRLKTQMEIAKMLVKEYVPGVRAAMSGIENVYIPGGNRELFEAAVIFYAISNKCGIPIHKDLSKYVIKTTANGQYIAYVHLKSERSDPEYKPTLDIPSYWACGDMTRISEKYPAVYSWSIDSRLSLREGGWQNNQTADYEYLYEFLQGMLHENAANAEKINRLRSRAFLADNGQINIMMVKGEANDFFSRIPSLDEALKEKYAGIAFECAMIDAKNYPSQMQDLVVSEGVERFIGREVAIMVMDLLYENGTFRPLTDREKITANLIMFSDILP